MAPQWHLTPLHIPFEAALVSENMSKALGALQQLRGLVTAASPSRCVLDVAGGLDQLPISVEHESDCCSVPLCAATAARPAAARQPHTSCVSQHSAWTPLAGALCWSCRPAVPCSTSLVGCSV